MSSSANYTFQWNSFSTFLFFNSSKFISIFILINIIKFNFQKIFSAPINCYIAFLTFTEITSVIPSSPYWFCINNITPTDQSIDFPSSHLWLLAVAQQMEFQAFHHFHSVYHNFRYCQLTFFKFSSMKYFRRSLFNYSTPTRKNVNT